MTWKSMKNIVMYSVIVAVLFTASFQPNHLSNNFDRQDNFYGLDPDIFAQGLPSSDTTMDINEVLYNYTEIGSWSDSGQVYDVIVDGDFAFVADGSEGLRIINITDKTNPQSYGMYKNGSAILRGLYKNGNYLYLAYGSNGFEVLDLSLGYITPVYVKQYTTIFGGAECYSIDVEGNWTYAACGTYGMAIFNSTNVDDPTYKGRYYKSGVDIRDVDVYINFAYLADANYGVRRVDIASSKIHPIESGYGYASGSAFGIVVREDYYACVADNSGFLLLSLYSYPYFTKTYQYSDGTHASGVFSAYDTAFVSYSSDIGLRMYNISDKLDPHFIGKFNDGGDGRNIVVDEEYAYLCDGTDGLEIINLDSDSDKLYDGYEIYDLFTDEFNPDTDNDTLLDGDEFYGYEAPDNPYADDETHEKGYFYGLDPLNNDTDGDTIRDDEEIYLGVDGYRTDPESDDSDEDGLTDNDEINIHLTDPTDTDTDNDLLTDGDEINVYGTNPLSKDTDSDYMPDHYEILYGLNATLDDALLDFDTDGLTNLYEYNVSNTRPDRNDTDNDLLLDGEEIYGIYWPTNPHSNATGYIVTNKPRSADADGDGLLDGEEVKFYDTNPLDADSDDDGLTDEEEVITHLTNPNNNDTDGDQMDDYWEATYNTDPLVDDTLGDLDNDGLTNFEEFNLGTDPQDRDTDNDGMDDGWEIDNFLNPLSSIDGLLDPDQDGLTNFEEFEADTDPNNADTDSDTLGDKWEVDNGTDPLVADATDDPDEDGLTNLEEMEANTDPFDDDSDRDGLSDGDEVKVYGTNPNDPDSDHDGFSDLREIEAGTDPNDANSDPDQKKLLLYVSIGSSIAGGIVLLLLGFFISFWISRPIQKMFRYLNSLKRQDVESVTLKEVSVALNKQLNRGEIKQTINEFGDSKGFTLGDNRVYFVSETDISKRIAGDYSALALKAKEGTIKPSERQAGIKSIEKDLKLSNKLGFKYLVEELEELLTTINK